MNDVETTLVIQAKSGSRVAFDELIRRTSRLVYARLFLECGDKHRSEDLLQETLILAYRSLSRLSEPAGFRSWLLTIAHNVAIDSARKAGRKKRTAPTGVLNITDLTADELPPDEVAAREELRERVLGVLRSLPEEYRLPITLRYITGADYETIAEQLGLTNGSLRGLLHRGLKLLRERLPPELAPGSAVE